MRLTIIVKVNISGKEHEVILMSVVIVFLLAVLSDEGEVTLSVTTLLVRIL